MGPPGRAATNRYGDPRSPGHAVRSPDVPPPPGPVTSSLAIGGMRRRGFPGSWPQSKSWAQTILPKVSWRSRADRMKGSAIACRHMHPSQEVSLWRNQPLMVLPRPVRSARTRSGADEAGSTPKSADRPEPASASPGARPASPTSNAAATSTFALMQATRAGLRMVGDHGSLRTGLDEVGAAFHKSIGEGASAAAQQAHRDSRCRIIAHRPRSSQWS